MFCLVLQDILGGTSAEQINLFSSRLAPKLGGRESDAPTEFYMVERCLAGTPFYFVPACIITSLRDFAFVLFHKTFWAAPRNNKFICSPLGLLQNWADGWVTLLRSSKRKIHFIQGLRPSGCIPACILSSLRDYFRTTVLCRDSASLHFASQGIGRRLGRDYACITLRSACSDIPACILTSRRDLLWGGDAPTEFYMVERCLAGTPFYFVPACIITSLRDSSFVLFYKTFWAAPRQSSSELFIS